MAGQLLPIRLFSSAGILRASPCSVVFGAAVSLRLKNSLFSSRPCLLISRWEYSGGRAFAGRTARSGARGVRRGELGAGSVSSQSKSLIEDEEELSDWISDLKTNSFHPGLSSEDESPSPARDKVSKDMNKDWSRGEGRERDSLSSVRSRPPSRRNRDGDSDTYSSRSRRDSSSRKRFDSDDNGDNYEDDFPDRRKNELDNRHGSSSGSRRGLANRNGASSASGRGLGNRYGASSAPGRGLDNRHGASSAPGRGLDNRHGASSAPGRGPGASSSSGRGLDNRHGASSVPGRGLDNRHGTSSAPWRGLDNRHGASSAPGRGLDNGHGASSSSGKRGWKDYEIGGRGSQSKRGPAVVLSDEDDEDDEDDVDDVDDEDDEDDEDDKNEDEDEESDDDVMSDFEDNFFGDKEDRKDRVLKSAFATGSSLSSAVGDHIKTIPQTSGSDSYLSQARFDQCTLSPLSLKGIKAAGYERMTVVQEATLPFILKGKDVLAKAKTGTGKTVAFLLPAIEVVAKLPPVDRDNRRPPIHVLVICPTRELADQAAAEASKLLKFHPSIGVQVVMGGTRLALEQKRMQANPCQILVATPGRLRDHIENTPGFASRLTGVKVLVLDEADRLLDMGFRKDIEKIVAAVPKQRQTLLFSATIPDEVRQICYIAMKRDHEFISTVEEGSEETHSQVRQMHLIAPLEKQFSVLYGILTDHIAEDVDYKVIVFCTTAMVTKLVADLLAELNLNVREIHSRKPQSYRTRVSKEFKESKGLILVSSDVSARGVDYPNVTLVIQIGVPADREQYIHRLGRTGRIGNEGKGILLLAPWEDFFLASIQDLPITKAEEPLIDPDTRKKVERALAHVEMRSKESAYQAWLGYYNSNKNIGRDKNRLVALANEFSHSIGLDNPPAIAKLVLRKMGLNNVPGLRSK